MIEAYDAKHQVVMEGADKAVLVLGQEDWPFPIPLVRKDGTWRFDTAAGREEILFRRIGRNELSAIQAMSRLCRRAARIRREGHRRQRRVRTTHRQPAGQEGRSLLAGAIRRRRRARSASFAASAAAEGYRAGQQRIPYHGYYYKVLTRQGPSAPGGALDYVVRGKMIGGFALVAYPAEYGNSGVMTFLVNHQGTIYEKDLGPHTAGIAAGMTAFNPDSTWQRVSEADQASSEGK